jgi:phosphopantetheine adenylyltransferase
MNLNFLLERPLSLYVVATGAGAGIQQEIWRVPGCTAFLKGASFPYAYEESRAFAGTRPTQHASQDFAYDLAAAAYMRAIDLNEPLKEPVGLALTASVSGLNIHHGDHRLHLVCMTRDRTIGRTVILTKKGVGPEARAIDGDLADLHALQLLVAALNPNDLLNADFENQETKARERFFENPLFWKSVRRCDADELNPRWPLFPGAFNPPHKGHEGIADKLGSTKGACEPVFAICANPPHKTVLNVQEMLRRAKMLKERAVLFTRNDPLFIDKARAHPGTPLVIGVDALLRMLDPKWGVDVLPMLQEFEALGTTFLVFGREIDGTFVTVSDAVEKAPCDYWKLFREVPGRWDVSSTNLRHRPDLDSDCIQSGEDAPIRSAAV